MEGSDASVDTSASKRRPDFLTRLLLLLRCNFSALTFGGDAAADDDDVNHELDVAPFTL